MKLVSIEDVLLPNLLGVWKHQYKHQLFRLDLSFLVRAMKTITSMHLLFCRIGEKFFQDSTLCSDHQRDNLLDSYGTLYEKESIHHVLRTRSIPWKNQSFCEHQKQTSLLFQFHLGNDCVYPRKALLPPSCINVMPNSIFLSNFRNCV